MRFQSTVENCTPDWVQKSAELCDKFRILVLLDPTNQNRHALFSTKHVYEQSYELGS